MGKLIGRELKAIEINASERLGGTMQNCKGPWSSILINPDAHSIEGLSDIAWRRYNFGRGG